MTVHFEQDGVPVSMLLDLVEVPRSHSGLNLAKCFRDILEEFGVSDKVSMKNLPTVKQSLTSGPRYSASPAITPPTTAR